MLPAPQFSQVLRFLSAGGLGVLLYFLTFFVLTDLLRMWYLASAVIASIVNYSTNFLLHKFWTFGDKKLDAISSQGFQYAILVGATFLANLLFLFLLVEYAHLGHLAAQAIVTAILTVISYFATRQIFTD